MGKSKKILNILSTDNKNRSCKQQQEPTKQQNSQQDFRFSKGHLPSNEVQNFPIQINSGESATNKLELIHDYKSFHKQ